jgi:hypothetical protein
LRESRKWQQGEAKQEKDSHGPVLAPPRLQAIPRGINSVRQEYADVSRFNGGAGYADARRWRHR